MRDNQEVEEFLSKAEIRILEEMPWSSNCTFVCELKFKGVTQFGVYKPGALERPLWDFPPDLFKREIAAYRLGVISGLVNIAPTVERNDAPLGPGCLQLFIEATSEHYFTLAKNPEYQDALYNTCVFDLITNNADRKSGHVLKSKNGEIYSIDHGLCFHVEPKLRTVIWDFAGQKLRRDTQEALSVLLDLDLDELKPYLSSDEILGLKIRVRKLLETKVLPKPIESRRSYPWPPV